MSSYEKAIQNPHPGRRGGRRPGRANWGRGISYSGGWWGVPVSYAAVAPPCVEWSPYTGACVRRAYPAPVYPTPAYPAYGYGYGGYQSPFYGSGYYGGGLSPAVATVTVKSNPGPNDGTGFLKSAIVSKTLGSKLLGTHPTYLTGKRLGDNRAILYPRNGAWLATGACSVGHTAIQNFPDTNNQTIRLCVPLGVKASGGGPLPSRAMRSNPGFQSRAMSNKTCSPPCGPGQACNTYTGTCGPREIKLPAPGGDPLPNRAGSRAMRYNPAYGFQSRALAAKACDPPCGSNEACNYYTGTCGPREIVLDPPGGDPLPKPMIADSGKDLLAMCCAEANANGKCVKYVPCSPQTRWADTARRMSYYRR